MSVALPALRRLSAVFVIRDEARWVLHALYLTAVIVGLGSGHPVGSVLLGTAVLTRAAVRRWWQTNAAALSGAGGRGR
jgi:hypothetical protein